MPKLPLTFQATAERGKTAHMLRTSHPMRTDLSLALHE